MRNFNKTLTLLAMAVAVATGAQRAAAAGFTIDFDGVAPGTPATNAAPAGVSFLPAVYDYSYDEYGDAIPGSLHWQVDATLPANIVTVEATLPNAWGAAPSGANALDARWQPTLMHFDHPIDIASFSTVLDNSTYGNLFSTDLLFLNAQGGVLASRSLDQTIPGLVAQSAGAVFGVSDILLPSSAFYDNISVSAVPVPAALWLFGSALGGVGFVRRRA